MAEEGLEMMNGNSSPGVTQEYLNTQICALQGRINELAVAVTEVSKHTAELRFETNELRHQLKVQTERFWGVAIGGTLILASKDLGIFPETAAVVLLSGGSTLRLHGSLTCVALNAHFAT
jgi:hypothetical protein